MGIKAPSWGFHVCRVILQGTDGGIEHAISVIGNWVFDSNVDVALPLKREVLDWCVMGKYVCAYRAIRFFLPNPNKTNKIQGKK